MIDLNPSRNLAAHPRASRFPVLILLAGLLAIRATQAAGLAATNTPAAIPWNQIGAKAGADYKGDGLGVTATGSGARLHCAFQRLDGEATSDGLWLTSTVTNTVSDRFRVTAMAVGRVADMGSAAQPRRGDMFIVRAQPNPIQAPSGRHDAGVFGGPANAAPPELGAAWTIADYQHGAPDGAFLPDAPHAQRLPDTGKVAIDGQTVRLSRPGLTEEYSVSMDGVRQDFIIE